MNGAALAKVLGVLSVFLAGVLLLPVPLSLVDADGVHGAFLAASALAGGLGGGLLAATRRTRPEMALREGFAVVTLGWLLFGILGALPYRFAGSVPSLVDAVFESLSGFTTTGATILTDVEALPRSLLLWRALTHWLGGMGIIVLSLAILPMLGVGGMQLFRAEVPGPTADRLSPRIQDTAKLLWGVYVGLTVAEVLLLLLGGLGWFDAICHAFATMATGGFSTRNASVAAFDSAYVDGVITLFMFLAGVNFALHYAILANRGGRVLRNEELRFYTALTLAATAVLMLANAGKIYPNLFENLRYSSFQAVSILTTTGFGTADYETWPVVCQIVLMLLMLVGGSAGSTGGGMKVSRVLLIAKHAVVQAWSLIHPRGVRRVKLDGRPVPEAVLQGVLGFFALYLACTALGTMGIAALGVDPVTSLASVIACVGNIGPGLGSVEPAENYAHLPQLGKALLSFCMLLGRLEILTVLVVFFPSAWRR
ncbi:MAG: TrkH family potassium uptake protein [Deltaproteobacteria bacterium]|nr:TrkH family potassium uptake protein [Deltaproteobacteria bacterium]